jgi:uncharacterized protein YegL
MGLHLLILLGLFAQAGEGVTTDYVVILLDASGSMKERMPGQSTDKIDAARHGLRQVLGGLPISTHVGLIAFGRHPKDQSWLYPLGERNDAELNAAIDRIRPDGGTPLGEFMKIAADRLIEARNAAHGYGTYRLLIVTDGEAKDKRLVERHTPAIIARGITIDVIGVAMARNHTLATKVHSYRRADDPDSLTRAIAEVFAEVGDANSGGVDNEAFDDIAPLPDELALAILSSMTALNKNAIGERTKPARAQSAATPANQHVSTPSNAAPIAAVTDPGSATGQPRGGWPFVFSLLAVVVVFFMIIIGKVMARSRG